MPSLRSCFEQKSPVSVGPFLHRIDPATKIHPIHMPLLGQVEYPVGNTQHERNALTILEFAANIEHHDISPQNMNVFRDMLSTDNPIDRVLLGSVGFAGSYACAVWKMEMENEGPIAVDVIMETARILLFHYQLYLRRYENNNDETDVTGMFGNIRLFATAVMYATTVVVGEFMSQL